MLHETDPCIEFSVDSRCDRCGMQAFMCAERGGKLLLFCGHHSKNYKQALIDDGWNLTWDSLGYSDLAPNQPQLALV